MQHLGRFGLTNALLNILNTSTQKEADAVIAQYLLQYLNYLDKLTIYDIAEACFTTRQSVSRFFRKMGLVNLRTFKKERLALEYYLTNESIPDYPSYLAQELSYMALDINACAAAYLDQFCEQLHMSRECVFLVSDIYSSSCLEFQKQMIVYGKMVRIVSNNFQENNILSNLTEYDLVIVVSISGRWAKELLETIQVTPAWRILLTALHDEKLKDEFDDVYLVSHADKPQKKTVYHMFAIPYLLELLQKKYRESYTC